MTEKEEGRVAAELLGKRWKAEQEAKAEADAKAREAKAKIAKQAKEPGGSEHYGGTVSVFEAIVLYFAILASAFIYIIWGMVGPDPINIFKPQGDPRMPVWIVLAGAGMFAINALRLIPWKGAWLLLSMGHGARGSEAEKKLGAEFARQSYSVFMIIAMITLMLGLTLAIMQVFGGIGEGILENKACGMGVAVVSFAIAALVSLKLLRSTQEFVRTFYLESQKFSLGLRMFYTLLFISVILLPLTYSIFTFGAMEWVRELFFLSIFIGAIATSIDLPLVLGLEKGMRWAGVGALASAVFYLPALLGWLNLVQLPAEIGGVYGAVLLASVASSFLLGFLRKEAGSEDNATAAISFLASLAYVAQPAEQNAIIGAILIGMAALIAFRAWGRKPEISAKQ